MAPNLKPPQLKLIRHMIQSKSLTTSQMAYVADCSKQSIVHIRSNLEVFGNVRAPRNDAGRPRSITLSMLEALCEHLMEKPTLYQDKMVIFLWDEFRKHMTIQSISRALASIGWSKKAARQIAKEGKLSQSAQDSTVSAVLDFAEASQRLQSRAPKGPRNTDRGTQATTGLDEALNSSG